jgi:hypothetical protein
MKIAVIIPFRGDGELLRWTLEGYGEQRLGARQELDVHVGVDGDDVAVPSTCGAKIWKFPRMGAAAVRNEVARRIAAEVLIFGNGDARPEPEMVRVHVETLMKQSPGTMVLGAAPWEKPLQPTVFDALLADTPMVFFYSQLVAGEWYDFRHAWTLNLSVRHADFVASGGFEELLRPVYYEDLAFGFKLLGPTRRGILYEPAAKVLHRHPTTLEQYLNREELLGLMSPVLAKVCPEVFEAIHGERGVEEMAAEYRMWVRMDAASHRWVYQRMAEWAALPESALAHAAGADAARLKMTIFQMHVPLKRLAFRLGFLRGMELVADGAWLERQPRGLWRKAIGV